MLCADEMLHVVSCCVLCAAAVDCVASCELQLSDMWQGLAGDIVSREFSLVPAVERGEVYPSGSVGQLRVTLVAARALKTLREQSSSSQ